MPPKRPPARGGRSAAPVTHENIMETKPPVAQMTQPTTTDTQAEAGNNTQADDQPASSSSVRRLDTLQASPLGAPSRGRGAAGRPAARPRGIGRRSQRDRAELEKAEQERKQAEAASQAREIAWRQRRDLARGRGSTRGRQRGGYAGETERRKDAPQSVSGPFSLGEVSKDKGVRGSGTGRIGMPSGSRVTGGTRPDGNQNMLGGTRSHIKQERGDAVMTDVHIKQEDGGYISSDTDEDGPKLNVDNLIDLTGEDEDEAAYLPPVRIQRIEHKERVLVANADASATKDTNTDAVNGDRRRGKQRAKDVEITGEKHRYRGTYSDSSSEDEQAIKAEPVDDGAGPDLQSPPTSPDTRRKAKEKIKTDITNVQKPSFQTKEEELEWEIHQRDLRVLHSELGVLELDNTTDGEATTTAQDPRADKVYLFQLPAILPELVPVLPKLEDDDIDMSDVPEVGTSQATEKKKPFLSTQPNTTPSGLVGKLRIHASGRAFLDWGGIPMEVAMGQEASFLQDILVLDAKDNKTNATAGGEVDVAGRAMSMGQVKGKFVVIPEWDQIFESLG